MSSVSPVFEFVSNELQRRTALSQSEARGTIRIGLKDAGLDVASVDAVQMSVMLRKLLPKELKSLRIDNGEDICGEIAAAIADLEFEAPSDRVGSAAATIGRFGR